jgi:hypothetical protein
LSSSIGALAFFVLASINISFSCIKSFFLLLSAQRDFRFLGCSAAVATADEAFSSDVSAPPLLSAQWMRLPSFFVPLFSFTSEVFGIVKAFFGCEGDVAAVPFPLLLSTFFSRLDSDDARGASTFAFFAGGGADVTSLFCRFTGALFVPFVDLFF